MSLTFLCLFINPWTMRHIFTNISDKLKNLSILYSTHTEYPYQMTKVLLIEQDINKVQGSYTQQRWSEQTILDMVFYDNGYNQTPCVKPSSDKVFSGLGHCCPCRCPNTWLLYNHNYYIFTGFFVIEKMYISLTGQHSSNCKEILQIIVAHQVLTWFPKDN